MAAGDMLSRFIVPRLPSSALPLDRNNARNILLLRLDGIGDNVCSWPSLELLRRQLPSARITLATGPWVAPLYGECPWIDEIVPWDTALYGIYRNKGLKGLRADLDISTMLRKRCFDAGIDLRGDLRSIILLWMTSPPIRVGNISCGGKRFLTDPVQLHGGFEAQRTFDVTCTSLGIPTRPVPTVESWPRPMALHKAIARLKAAGWQERVQTVAICPLALWPWRQWPTERFHQLASRLKNECEFQVVWFIENNDQAERYGISDPFFCGPLDEVAAALSLCSLAVSCDSGLMHLAIAEGCRTVQLFGPGDAERFSHTGKGTELIHDTSCLQYPCTQRGTCLNKREGWCMEKISVDQVFSACSRLVQQTATPLIIKKEDS